MSVFHAWSILDNPPASTDCFVIPSYGLRNRVDPSLPTRSEIDLAFAWWQRFPHAKLILSTGDNQGLGITNAKVMAQYAAKLGIPLENLIEEDRSRNTYQNLVNSWNIIKSEDLHRPTLVTIDLYMRRAVATARKIGWVGFHWLSVYSEGESSWGYKWLQTRSRLTIFGYEVAASVFSKIAGWE